MQLGEREEGSRKKKEETGSPEKNRRETGKKGDKERERWREEESAFSEVLSNSIHDNHGSPEPAAPDRLLGL